MSRLIALFATVAAVLALLLNLLDYFPEEQIVGLMEVMIEWIKRRLGGQA